MEIPNRTQFDAAFARKLSRLSTQHRNELIALMGHPPDVRRVPASFWQRIEREQREALGAALLLLFGESFRFHVELSGGELTPRLAAVAQAEATTYAATRATQLAKDYVDGLQKRLDEIAAKKWSTPAAAPAEPVGQVEPTPAQPTPAPPEQSTAAAKAAAQVVADADDAISKAEVLAELLKTQLGPNAAAKTAVTETTGAQTAGGDAGIAATVGTSDDDVWQIHPELSLSGACPQCRPLDGRPRRIWRIDAPNGPPLHPNCLLPSTNVLASLTIAAMRAWYDGPTVTIRTTKGRRLTVTANHQILTRDGFVPADRIQKGDYIIASADNVAAAVVPNNNDVPTSAIEKFTSFSKCGRMFGGSVPAAAEHFHGDGMACDGNIDVIATDRLFGRTLEPRGFYGGNNLPLCSAWDNDFLASVSDFDSMLVGMSSAARGGVGFSSDGSALLCGGSNVAVDGGIAAGTRNKPGFGHSGSDSFSAHANLLGQLVDRYPGFVAFDCVDDVECGAFHGFVYDFQTASGLYFADGILTSNCNCEIIYANAAKPEIVGVRESADESDGHLVTIRGHRVFIKNRKPGEHITDTPEFKKWFGDSKVVGEDGKPLVVYHGVKRGSAEMKIENGEVVFFPHFNVFNKDGKTEPGIWFTPDKNIAEKYGTPVAFYLKASKPIRNEAPLKSRPTDGDAVYRMRGKGDLISEAWEIAVFEPNQIKLASGNRGTFDVNNPDIRESQAA